MKYLIVILFINSVYKDDVLKKCQKHAQKSLIDGGKFVPRCKPDGTYEDVQCDGSSGECWCVDKQGKEIPQTRSKDQVKCPQQSECDTEPFELFFFLTFIIQYLIIYHFTTLEDPLTSCQKQYQDSWRNPAAGRSVPLCNSDGTYSKVQCYLSTCYCVDTNGNQIKGTSVNSLRDGLPNCDDDPGKFMI